MYIYVCKYMISDFAPVQHYPGQPCSAARQGIPVSIQEEQELKTGKHLQAMLIQPHHEGIRNDVYYCIFVSIEMFTGLFKIYKFGDKGQLPDKL